MSSENGEGRKLYRFHGMASSMLMFPHLITDGPNMSQQIPYCVIAWEHTVDHSVQCLVHDSILIGLLALIRRCCTLPINRGMV